MSLKTFDFYKCTLSMILHNIQQEVLFLQFSPQGMPLFLAVRECEEIKSHCDLLFPLCPSMHIIGHKSLIDHSFHHTSVARSPGKNSNTPGKKKEGKWKPSSKGHINIVKDFKFFWWNKLQYKNQELLRPLFQEARGKESKVPLLIEYSVINSEGSYDNVWYFILYII